MSWNLQGTIGLFRQTVIADPFQRCSCTTRPQNECDTACDKELRSNRPLQMHRVDYVEWLLGGAFSLALVS
jgi:hypothetical protein